MGCGARGKFPNLVLAPKGESAPGAHWPIRLDRRLRLPSDPKFNPIAIGSFVSPGRNSLMVILEFGNLLSFNSLVFFSSTFVVIPPVAYRRDLIMRSTRARNERYNRQTLKRPSLLAGFGSLRRVIPETAP